jgi:molybdopterin-containing oxidoreductase family membrane subunit
VTLFAGFTVIFFDIDNPFRMAIYNVISPNLTSNIWWMGTLYGVALLFVIVEFIFLLSGIHKYSRYAGLLGLIAKIAAISNLGAVFGMLFGREYWYGTYFPVYLIASAVASGCAAIIFFTWLGYKINNEKMNKPMERAIEAVSKLCVLMIAVILFFTAWQIITGLVGASGKQDVIMAMLFGSYSFNFWVLEIMIGMVIPFILLIKTQFKNINVSFLAAAMMTFGIFFMRYDFVVLGQIVPAYYELGVNEYAGLLHYTPSFHEIMITVGGMGIVATAFLLGERIFKGHKVSDIH